MEYTAFNWDTFATLHGINCIQSRCMDSTSFTRDAFHNAASDPVHSIMLHGIHCIQSGSIGPHCMESTAFTQYPLQHAAWIPLHPTWIHCPTLHAIHCIHSGCISQRCMESSAFNHSACNSVHQSRPIGPCCMESTAFNQDPLGHAAWKPLHSIMLHKIHCIQ